MKNRQRKFMAVFGLFSMLALASSFCYVSVANAEMNMANGPVAIEMPNCGETGMVSIQKSLPANNALMPCCIDRHSEAPATLTNKLEARIKFSEISTVTVPALDVITAEQKTYISSPSPPPKPDILSTVVKIE